MQEGWLVLLELVLEVQPEVEGSMETVLMVLE
jgi:hypothetical protein